jgi:hypothetical protein
MDNFIFDFVSCSIITNRCWHRMYDFEMTCRNVYWWTSMITVPHWCLRLTCFWSIILLGKFFIISNCSRTCHKLGFYDICPEDFCSEDICSEEICPLIHLPVRHLPEDFHPNDICPEDICSEYICPEDIFLDDIFPNPGKSLPGKCPPVKCQKSSGKCLPGKWGNLHVIGYRRFPHKVWIFCRSLG